MKKESLKSRMNDDYDKTVKEFCRKYTKIALAREVVSYRLGMNVASIALQLHQMNKAISKLSKEKR